MISSGVVLHLYSNVITAVRLTSSTQTAQFIGALQGIGGTLVTINTMFAGMFLEVVFLVGLRMYVHNMHILCTCMHTHTACTNIQHLRNLALIEF